jgi:hypothetical protein
MLALATLAIKLNTEVLIIPRNGIHEVKIATSVGA